MADSIPLTAPDVRDLINAAVEDVGALPRYKYPSMMSVAVNHPGFMTHQVLTDDEYQQKRKYDELMRRLEGIREEYPDQFYAHRFGTLPNGEPMTGRDVRVGPQDTSPYRKRGLTDPGMFLSNAVQVLQSPFSVVANTARSTYDLDKAASEAPYVANKATGGVWNAIQGKDPNPSWSAEREWAGKVPFNSPLMMLTEGNPGVAYGALYQPKERGTIEGPEFLREDAGLPDHPATDMAGYLLEAAVDPVTGATQAVRHVGRAARVMAPAARNAHLLRAGRLLGQEMALPATWTGLGMMAGER
jgi:hypothetical protein